MSSGIRYGPTFTANYSWGELDGYRETGDPRANAIFGAQEFESLVTQLGWQVTWAHETKWATLTPQLRLGYGRENLNQEENLSAELENSPFLVIQGNNVSRTGGFALIDCGDGAIRVLPLLDDDA